MDSYAMQHLLIYNRQMFDIIDILERHLSHKSALQRLIFSKHTHTHTKIYSFLFEPAYLQCQQM